MKEEYSPPFEHEFEKVRSFVEQNSDVVTKEMADIVRFLSEVFTSYAFWMPAIVLSLIANGIIRDRRDYEQQTATKEVEMIPLKPDTYILFDRSMSPDVLRTDTGTQIIYEYPNGEEPFVIELGSRVHPNELDDLKAMEYQNSYLD